MRCIDKNKLKYYNIHMEKINKRIFLQAKIDPAQKQKFFKKLKSCGMNYTNFLNIIVRKWLDGSLKLGIE